MYTKALSVWYSLPHQVQALILAVATAAGTAFIHALSEGNCYTKACLEHYASVSVAAGIAAVKLFYMRPGPGPNGVKAQ
jgi:hypothetical protein